MLPLTDASVLLSAMLEAVTFEYRPTQLMVSLIRFKLVLTEFLQLFIFPGALLLALTAASVLSIVCTLFGARRSSSRGERLEIFTP